VRPFGCLGAPGALGRRQRAIGVYFTLETVQERGTARLGRFSWVTPGVDESLMMLEEAPRALMLDVEDEQRDVRSTSLETDTD
jgi:hypothetical protein